MKITKTLKGIVFEYDDEKKMLTIEKVSENNALYERMEISKVYMFSLMRFWTRITQREFRRNTRTKKEVKETWVFADAEHEAEEFLGSRNKAVEYFAKKLNKSKEYINSMLTPF
uniref:Uncharacterized protein n=1 Tax=Caldisericum exile TaxID=693075 RepID=A0A7C4XUB1_9BACT